MSVYCLASLFVGNDRQAREWVDNFLDAKPELDSTLEAEWSSELAGCRSSAVRLLPDDSRWAHDFLKDKEHIEW
jgi:hypothetical protein